MCGGVKLGTCVWSVYADMCGCVHAFCLCCDNDDVFVWCVKNYVCVCVPCRHVMHGFELSNGVQVRKWH